MLTYMRKLTEQELAELAEQWRGELIERGAKVKQLSSLLSERRAELRTAALKGLECGLSELEVSKLAGVTRDSVRKWQGK